MSFPDLPLAGGCRCGRVRFEVSARPILTSACHCRGCQRMSASAFSLSAMFPANGFRVIAGAPVTGGLQGPDLDHFFCPGCKSWLFTRIAGFEQVVNVRAPLFDEVGWITPFLETMTAERLPWVRLPAARSYAGFPEPEDFPELVTAFTASLAGAVGGFQNR